VSILKGVERRGESYLFEAEGRAARYTNAILSAGHAEKQKRSYPAEPLRGRASDERKVEESTSQITREEASVDCLSNAWYCEL